MGRAAPTRRLLPSSSHTVSVSEVLVASTPQSALTVPSISLQRRDSAFPRPRSPSLFTRVSRRSCRRRPRHKLYSRCNRDNILLKLEHNYAYMPALSAALILRLLEFIMCEIVTSNTLTFPSLFLHLFKGNIAR